MIDYSSLTRLYGGSVERAGNAYPVAVQPLPHGRLRVADKPVSCDAALLALGLPHLERLRAARPALHDGGLLCWVRTDENGVLAAPGGYFDMLATCDAIRAEHLAAGGDQPLRSRAHAVAGDPLVSGAGRAAGIGVSVLLTVAGQDDGLTVADRDDALTVAGQDDGLTMAGRDDGRPRRFVIGRRSRSVATDPGMWHVAPSGMLEPDAQGRHWETTVSRELAEELGVEVGPAEVARRATVLGIAHDLLRLRPDLVFRLDLTPAEARAVTAGDGEFADVQQVELSAGGIERFWTAHPPSVLTPAAAGAVALLEGATNAEGATTARA
ncbi:NUDIX domain-containing protein [Actinoplanes sp. KI2]|uniref:NUDIX domain-containing protein n=1 Tax=Actinoplanes sp. KI2 TaxID=2983315 RepID=UPI0021D591F4|nr:NUDIX domain-containing protein [Actinoplanes sp. KI2]MCU7728091.1 NUDIX domain-containing protein [Actinoplanes sp. KI2]